MSPRLPFEGRVRIFDNSSLRKLMRAARRGKIPGERLGVIMNARLRAARRAGFYANSSSSS